jgi:hypothetical protein
LSEELSGGCQGVKRPGAKGDSRMDFEVHER